MVRLIGLTLMLGLALIDAKHLVFPPADAVGPALVCLGLAGVAFFYHGYRPAPNFVLCAKALLVLVAFSTAYSLLMYALAAGGRPLGDAKLAEIDGSLGLSAGEAVRFVDARPWLELAMRIVYFSLIPQTILAIVLLGLGNDRPRLDRFLLRFMLAALVTAIGFYLLPAIGTCASYHLPIPPHYMKVVEHLDAMRSGRARWSRGATRRG